MLGLITAWPFLLRLGSTWRSQCFWNHFLLFIKC